MRATLDRTKETSHNNSHGASIEFRPAERINERSRVCDEVYEYKSYSEKFEKSQPKGDQSIRIENSQNFQSNPWIPVRTDERKSRS